MAQQFKHGVVVKAKDDKATDTQNNRIERSKIEGIGCFCNTQFEVDEDNQDFITMTDFGYLFLERAKDPSCLLPSDNPQTTIENLKRLGDEMVDNEPPTELNSTIPPVYTYWGQFIDHDMTANTDRDGEFSNITEQFSPKNPDNVITRLKNLRCPTLNLDSVYGDGPQGVAAELYQGNIFLKVGQNEEKDFISPPGGLERDLPRKEDKSALIGDNRNEENLLIGQFHTAFLRFHNEVVKLLKSQNKDADFQKARQLVTWHYQWLVVHDYLETVTTSGTVDRVLQRGLTLTPQDKEFFKFFNPEKNKWVIPLEYSVAAFRFAHSMVRNQYDLNANSPNVDFNILFLLTGGSSNPLGGADSLPSDRIVEWDRFIDRGSSVPERFARKIDTHLAEPLLRLLNEGEEAQQEMIRALLKQLAQRNLLRGYLLSIPTGQCLAAAAGIEPLTPDELTQNNSGTLNQVLFEGGFIDRTPAWFYLLKEAEVRANGNSLGELGSSIVAETIIGLLASDSQSYLNCGNPPSKTQNLEKDAWSPIQSPIQVGNSPIVTIGDLLHFAGVR